jgi:hypothetical protein
MGNIITLVLSYRLYKSQEEENKEEKNEEETKKENICNYLYGKCNIKDVRDNFTTDPLLREKTGKGYL